MSGAARWGYIPVLAFWFIVMGVVYLAIDHYMKPKEVIVSATGEVRIPRSRDGHFYIVGSVNGKPITFLVDTVNFERANAEGEVRRSFNGSYPPVYQAAYMLGALQFRALRCMRQKSAPTRSSGFAWKPWSQRNISQYSACPSFQNGVATARRWLL